MAVACTQLAPAPDSRNVTVFEHVHVVGQVADHQERRMPGLADKQGHGAGRVPRRGHQHQAAVTEEVVTSGKGRKARVVGRCRLQSGSNAVLAGQCGGS